MKFKKYLPILFKNCTYKFSISFLIILLIIIIDFIKDYNMYVPT